MTSTLDPKDKNYQKLKVKYEQLQEDLDKAKNKYEYKVKEQFFEEKEKKINDKLKQNELEFKTIQKQNEQLQTLIPKYSGTGTLIINPYHKALLFSKILGLYVFSLLTEITLFCILMYFTNYSNYWRIFILPPLILTWIIGLICLCSYNSWTYEEFTNKSDKWLPIKKEEATTACKCSSPNISIFRWRAVLFWVWLIFKIPLWIRPLLLYGTVNGMSGLGGSPVNASTCSNDPSLTYDTTPITNRYNPYGFFPVGSWNYFDSTQSYVFCTLHLKWAESTAVSRAVLGCQHDGNTNNCDCSTIYLPGSPYTYGNTACQTAFYSNHTSNVWRDPAKGVLYPFTFNSQISEISWCPGYIETNPGYPRKICSTCLNYWRTYSNNIAGPLPNSPDTDNYSHCPPYESNAINNPFCAFCPGLESPNSWLQYEFQNPIPGSNNAYAPLSPGSQALNSFYNNITISFGLTTALLWCFPFLEWIIYQELKREFTAAIKMDAVSPLKDFEPESDIY